MSKKVNQILPTIITFTEVIYTNLSCQPNFWKKKHSILKRKQYSNIDNFETNELVLQTQNIQIICKTNLPRIILIHNCIFLNKIILS